ncbi:MAG: xanthine dehydrogenase accessory protein XdhC [Janthinobacterium lividum]
MNACCAVEEGVCDTAWVTALRRHVAAGQAAVLVTVARVDGSAPREAGARMVVTHDACTQTIGGGNLEWRAIDIARSLLNDAALTPARRLVRLSLGASLGQCCGGAVTLAFERIGAGDAPWLDALAQQLALGQAARREVSFAPLAEGGVTIRDVAPAERVASADAADAADATASACLLHDGADARAAVLTETITPARMPVFVFGAGHVGAALVRILVSLPCAVTWVDERDTLFPAVCAPSVVIEALDAPESVIARAPAGAYFLVMTHSHALDERLAECILRRGDYAYFGLIGSHTKRRLFERRLAARGVAGAALARMVCPIGIAGITDKRPESIAVAVVAQLLQAREAHAARPSPAAVSNALPNVAARVTENVTANVAANVTANAAASAISNVIANVPSSVTS